MNFFFRLNYSSLVPKASSKKTKSRHFLMPGMPRERLLRKEYRNVETNHVLAANKNISRRERDFRRIMAQAMCASKPHNPDLSLFVAPYWLKNCEYVKQKGYFDPVVQSSAHTRLVRAFVAANDDSKKRSLMHGGRLRNQDLDQVMEIEERSSLEENVPKFDRIMNECEVEIRNSSFVHPGAESSINTIVEPCFSSLTASANNLNEFRRSKLMEAFRIADNDVGSPEVQAAMLTLRIRNLANHVNVNKKDTSSRVQLNHLTNRRRRILDYLKQVNFFAYRTLIKDLGLKVA
jgi:small subunit ribosomal protein S15